MAWFLRPKQYLMDVFGIVTARTPDDDPFTFFFPLQYGSGSDAEPSPNVGWD